MGRIKFTGLEEFYDDELVLDVGALEDVTRLIDGWASAGESAWVRRDDPAESALLGLAWIEVTGLPSVAETLRRDEDLVAEAHRRGARFYPGKPVMDLDLLLCALHAALPDAEVGKHRLANIVEGKPYTGGTGAPPKKADGVVLPPRGTTDRPRVRVGILDTPIWPHDGLAGRYVADTAAILPRAWREPPSMLAGHATSLAGIIVQRAPEADLVVRAGLDEFAINASSWDIAVKMMTFVAENVQVLNMSFATFTADDEAPLVIRRAVERLKDHMVLVAAAGNHGERPDKPDPGPGVTGRSKTFPAACDGVLAVGTGAAFSPKVPWVALMAPGEDVTTTYLEGAVLVPKVVPGTSTVDWEKKTFSGAASWSGTSFAAAAVSGAIADIAYQHGIPAVDAKKHLLHPSPTQAGTKRHDDICPHGKE